MRFRCRHVGLFSSYRASGNIDLIVSVALSPYAGQQRHSTSGSDLIYDLLKDVYFTTKGNAFQLWPETKRNDSTNKQGQVNLYG